MRPQLSLRAGFAPGEAKENWAILRAVSAAVGRTQPWDSLPQLRQRLVAEHPHLGRIDEVAENRLPALVPRAMGQGAFRGAVRDHYLTNPVLRASGLMGELAAMEAERLQRSMAAE